MIFFPSPQTCVLRKTTVPCVCIRRHRKSCFRTSKVTQQLKFAQACGGMIGCLDGLQLEWIVTPEPCPFWQALVVTRANLNRQCMLLSNNGGRYHQMRSAQLPKERATLSIRFSKMFPRRFAMRDCGGLVPWLMADGDPECKTNDSLPLRAHNVWLAVFLKSW